jgi:hypothetical protein
MYQPARWRQAQDRKLKIGEAMKLLVDEEAGKLVNEDEIRTHAINSAEQNGIVFIDEIDKVTSRSDGASNGRGGVAPGRAARPAAAVEGTTVSTRYGPIARDHILFIASGAFQMSKPRRPDPELQGPPADPRGAAIALGAGLRGHPHADPRVAGQAVPGPAGHGRRHAGVHARGDHAAGPHRLRGERAHRETSAPAACRP